MILNSKNATMPENTQNPNQNSGFTGIKGYVPAKGSSANPPVKIQEFLNQICIVHGGEVKQGDNYQTCTMDITTEMDNIRRSCSSSGEHIVGAIKDMTERKLFPCRVLVKQEGRALYFTTPPSI